MMSKVSKQSKGGTAGAAALAAWMATAVAVGAVAPAAVLARWGRDRVVARALLPSMALLGVQVAGEAASARRLPPWSPVVIGTACTVVRLGQLRTAAGLVAAGPAGASGSPGAARGRAAAAAVVRAGRVFWTANLAAIAVNTPRLIRAGRVPYGKGQRR